MFMASGKKTLVGSVFATIVGMCMLQFIAIIIVQLHIGSYLKLAFFSSVSNST